MNHGPKQKRKPVQIRGAVQSIVVACHYFGLKYIAAETFRCAKLNKPNAVSAIENYISCCRYTLRCRLNCDEHQRSLNFLLTS